jgi:Bacterial regulatory proteins, lacI family
MAASTGQGSSAQKLPGPTRRPGSAVRALQRLSGGGWGRTGYAGQRVQFGGHVGGLSVMTASGVVNDRDGVSPQTAARVRHARASSLARE